VWRLLERDRLFPVSGRVARLLAKSATKQWLCEGHCTRNIGIERGQEKTVGELVELDPFLTKVSKHFLENPPPTGWTPSDQDLSYLEKVFEKYWVE